MDWNAVAAALETAAKRAGINAIDHVPDSLPSEMFYVGEMDIDFDVTFRSRLVEDAPTLVRVGTDQATITCRILVARADDKHSVRRMRKYMSGSGPSSVAAALSVDKTLGGTVDSSAVKRMRGNRLFDVGSAKYYGIEIDVFVIGAA